MAVSRRSPAPFVTRGLLAVGATVIFSCVAERSSEPAGAVETEPALAPSADVTSIETSFVDDGSSEERVRFRVTVRSDDTGCDRYADWWEIVSLEGTLLQRRILTHSHVDEQPFTRSAPPLDLAPDRIVLVRAHLHPTGYVGTALQGSIESGWQPVEADSVAPGLALSEPLPGGCRF